METDSLLSLLQKYIMQFSQLEWVLGIACAALFLLHVLRIWKSTFRSSAITVTEDSSELHIMLTRLLHLLETDQLCQNSFKCNFRKNNLYEFSLREVTQRKLSKQKDMVLSIMDYVRGKEFIFHTRKKTLIEVKCDNGKCRQVYCAYLASKTIRRALIDLAHKVESELSAYTAQAKLAHMEQEAKILSEEVLPNAQVSQDLSHESSQYNSKDS